MPPANDDQSVGDDSAVYRALLPKWVTDKGGRERPTTDSLMDSNFENSVFAEDEITLDELRSIFPGLKIARIPVRILRAEGFWLERRSEEAPEKCSNPASHFVCGPPTALARGAYEAKARRIVKSEGIEIL